MLQRFMFDSVLKFPFRPQNLRFGDAPHWDALPISVIFNPQARYRPFPTGNRSTTVSVSRFARPHIMFVAFGAPKSIQARIGNHARSLSMLCLSVCLVIRALFGSKFLRCLGSCWGLPVTMFCIVPLHSFSQPPRAALFIHVHPCQATNASMEKRVGGWAAAS